eukprot:m51a1_g5073 putative ras gtpase-activating protein 1 (185) ;mRNA; r:192543-193262
MEGTICKEEQIIAGFAAVAELTIKPELSRETAKLPLTVCRPVGGFVLLHLYCPIITGAAASGILPQEPTGPQQHALVLVAKALQAITNGTVGTKEPFRRLHEPYISRASQRIRRWYDELTSVTEADLGRYAASVRRDETGAADPLLTADLCRTNIRGLGKTLVALDNKPLLVKLTGVLAHLGSV